MLSAHHRAELVTLPDDANHAPNWWSRVGRGFFRAWPRYAQSNSDERRIYPRPPPSPAIEFGYPPHISAPAPVTRDRIRKSSEYIRARPRYPQSNSDERRVDFVTVRVPPPITRNRI